MPQILLKKKKPPMKQYQKKNRDPMYIIAMNTSYFTTLKEEIKMDINEFNNDVNAAKHNICKVGH